MKLLLLAVALPLYAADPAGFQMWTKSELQTRANGLKLNQEKQAVDRMQTWGNHSVLLERLEGATGGEAHRDVSDMFVIVSGELNLTVGGTISGGATTPQGEVRGNAIEGGTTKKLAAGDIAHIPAKMPHQMSVDPGKTCTYLVFKVRAE
jgi:mannose-6-phosphate isomerase-like protein (cupin superfamily)